MRVGVLLAALDEFLPPVDGFRLAPQHHLHQSGGVDLLHGVGTFIHHPDILFGIDTHGMGKGRAVGIRQPFLDVFVVLVELEQPGRRAAARGAAPAGARIDEQMAGLVAGHAFGFAQGVAGNTQGKDFFRHRELG